MQLVSSTLPQGQAHTSATPLRFRLVGLSALGALGIGAAVAAYYWPRTIPLRPASPVTHVEWKQNTLVLTAPQHCFVLEAGTYDSELLAYLMYDYLRSRPALAEAEVLLVHREAQSRPETSVLILPSGNNLLAVLPEAAKWRAEGYLAGRDYGYAPLARRNQLRQQTKLFTETYRAPVHTKLEELPPRVLARYVRRFVRFKSLTDPRVRQKLDPQPEVLSPEQAQRLAGDILMVADFYHLPLDFFLGIGAMENNYMNVRGDREHTTWKRRAEPGDIVLRRLRGRVLVQNDALGAWQITRETLRYAHRLYLQDQRDYSQLPERLRPPRELDMTKIEPEVLTTYAGLLFRDLLDLFHGDVGLAVGAYNGGPARPNTQYEAGVRRVAQYAREVLEHAAARQGRTLAATSLASRTR